jgi:hypothetical protein
MRPPQARTQPTDVDALPTHVLVNGKGVEVHISPVGAVIERINIPDRSGQHTDVVLGFDQKTPYAVSTTCSRGHTLACRSPCCLHDVIVVGPPLLHAADRQWELLRHHRGPLCEPHRLRNL